MKTYIKKMFIIFVSIMILFNFCVAINYANAANNDDYILEIINAVSNIGGGIASIAYWPLRILIVGICYVFNVILMLAAQAEGTLDASVGSSWFITPFDIFFNKYKILDVNFFDLTTVQPDSLLYKLRSAIAQWYFFVRLLAITLLGIVIIYVGIRMSISTLAEDKAKYKKTLINWIASVCLIFILHYLIVFVVYTNNAIVEALKGILNGSDKSKEIEAVFGNIILNGLFGMGLKSLSSVIVFVFISIQTIGFFIAYINRMIKIGFLIIIAPLITVTYSIDKMGDGKAQALENWLKEFAFTILIQPFHCIMYLAFVKTALDLVAADSVIDAVFGFFSAEYNQLSLGLMAIFCLAFIKQGEEAVRKIFGFSDDSKDTSFAAGMAIGLTALNKSGEFGQKFSGMRNKSKAVSTQYKAKLTKGLENSEYGKKLLNTANLVHKPVDKIASAKKSLVARHGSLQKLDAAINGTKEKGNKHNGLRKIARDHVFKPQNINRAITLGAASMALASGSGLGVAIKVGSEASKTYAGYKESGKTHLPEETKDDVQSKSEMEIDLTEQINKEEKIKELLSKDNADDTHHMAEKYLKRENIIQPQIKEKKKKIKDLQADTSGGHEEEINKLMRDVNKLENTLRKPIKGDPKELVELYNAGELTNINSAGEKVLKPTSEYKAVKSEHNTTQRRLYTQHRAVRRGKVTRQNNARAMYTRGSNKKNLEDAKKNLIQAVKTLALEKQMGASTTPENVTLSESTNKKAEAKVEDIVKKIGQDLVARKNTPTSIDTYVKRTAKSMDLDTEDKETMEYLKAAMQKFLSAQIDSNFARDFDQFRKNGGDFDQL